jgi:membrane-associated protease RseP (regulator of RpoE activity)
MNGAGWRYNSNAKLDEVVTTADGSFLFEDLDPQPYQLTARHPDSPVVEVADVPAGSRAVRIVLPDEAVVAGRAVAEDGKPLRSYVVRLVPLASARARARSESQSVQDPNGAFEVRRLAAGRYDLVVSSQDGRSGRLAGITLAAGEARRDLVVTAGASAALTLRVEEHGTAAPIARARVSIQVGGESLASADSDAAGRVRLTGLPPAQDVTLAIQSPASDFSYLADSEQIVLPAAGASADLGTIALLRDNPSPPPGGKVGLVLTGRQGQVLVESVVPGSPAARAGITPGEAVLSIDGAPIRGLGPRGVGRLTSGPPGAPVSFTLHGPAGARQVTLTRSPDLPR